MAAGRTLHATSPLIGCSLRSPLTGPPHAQFRGLQHVLKAPEWAWGSVRFANMSTSLRDGLYVATRRSSPDDFQPLDFSDPRHWFNI